jgi:hypothetical protein
VGQPFNNGLNENGEDNDDPLRTAESTSAQDNSALEAVDEYNETREMVLFSREHRRVIRATNGKLAGIVNNKIYMAAACDFLTGDEIFETWLDSEWTGAPVATVLDHHPRDRLLRRTRRNCPKVKVRGKAVIPVLSCQNQGQRACKRSEC